MGIKISLILFFIAFMLILYVVYYHLHFEKYIVKKTKMKCLGYVPLNTNSRDLIIQSNLKSNVIEYIKDIRNNILNSGPNQIISIISCNKEEGKSFISNNLAISLARINKKVLLIDSDLRKISNKNEIFYLDGVEGLSDFIRSINMEDTLTNLYKTKKYIMQTQIPNLYVLQNGTITVNSSELLKSDNFHLLLTLLKEMYDYIIVDSTSFYENEDCLTVSSMADSNIFVIDKKTLNFTNLNFAKDQILNNNGKILGFILNKTNIKLGKYYGKKIKSKFGLYLEDSSINPNKKTIDDLITPIAKKIKKNNLNQFERLHQELRDNILVEDFINDIEVNFNLKLENINDICINTNKRIDNLLQQLEDNKNSSNDILLDYLAKLEHSLTSSETTQSIFENINSLKQELDVLKLNQTNISNSIQYILDKIENVNYDNKFEELKNEINSINFIKQISELKSQIENKNYDEHFNNLENQILNIQTIIENLNYDETFEDLKTQIENNNFTTKFEVSKLQNQNKKYLNRLEQIELYIKNSNINKKLAYLKSQIENKNYDEQFEELKNQINNIKIDFQNIIFDENSKKIDNNSNININKNNIINLEKFFTENNYIKTYSYEESISFNELENLACDVIFLNESDELNKKFGK